MSYMKYITLGEKSDLPLRNRHEQYLIMKDWYNNLIIMMSKEQAGSSDYNRFKTEMNRVRTWMVINPELKGV